MINPHEDFIVVDTRDPRLSLEMDIPGYVRTRDPALIIHGPKKAREFILRPLSDETLFHIDDRYMSESARWRAAFQFAIKAIRDNETLKDADVTKVDGETVCTVDYYKEFLATYGPKWVSTLGMIAYNLAGLPEKNPYLESQSG